MNSILLSCRKRDAAIEKESIEHAEGLKILDLLRYTWEIDYTPTRNKKHSMKLFFIFISDNQCTRVFYSCTWSYMTINIEIHFDCVVTNL